MWKEMKKDGDVTQTMKDVKICKSRDNMIVIERKKPRISISKEVNHSISHKPNLLISIVFVAVAFAFIPLLPILVAFVIGHWFSKQSKT